MTEQKKQYTFTTGPVIVSRAYLEPVTEANQFNRWINSVEVFPDQGNNLAEMRSQILGCAVDNGLVKMKDGSPDKTAFTQVLATIFKKLEQTNKAVGRNEHLAGKVFFAMNRSRRPKNRDLTDPKERKEWIAYLANECPKAYVLNSQGKRELIPHSKVREMIYPGCVVNVVGECYYAPTPFNRVCIDLQAVVLLEQRDRIGPPPMSRGDDNDPLLNKIGEMSANQGDELDGMFGDEKLVAAGASKAPSSFDMDDLPF